ncbi:MAG TPA: hypothetical protein VI643_05890 [Planctomycetota bacterium]|nr:hypothetical protein [Planctomycetota bacterium]
MSLPLLLTTLLLQVDTSFARLGDSVEKASARAVVLINGFTPHPFSRDAAAEAQAAGWQSADSKVAQALATHADLFAFSYSQNAAVDEIAGAKNKEGKTFADFVAQLKSAGYREIVLVGFSAGAVMARLFVEDNPDAGVTKVIQVCPPNAGSGWGSAGFAVRETQEPFVASLSKEARRKSAEMRAKNIPASVEFVVLMGTGAGSGDSVVTCESQWPQDLQKQGIPVAAVSVLHFQAMRTSKAAAKLAELVSTRQPRWTGEQVEKARAELLD